MVIVFIAFLSVFAVFEMEAYWGSAQAFAATSSPTEFKLQCASNEALVGFSGRSGNAIDAIGPICGKIDSFAKWVGDPSVRPIKGGAGGGAFKLQCPPLNVVSRVNVARDSKLNRIAYVDLECRPLAASGILYGSPVKIGSRGVRGQLGLSTMICPSSAVPQGLGGTSGNVINTIGLYCGSVAGVGAEKFNAGPSALSAGAPGGTGFKLSCEDGELLAGVAGRSGNAIDAVAAVCVQVNNQGQWVGGPSQRRTMGGSGGGVFSLTCPRNQLAKAVTATDDSGLKRISSLSVECSALDEYGEFTGSVTKIQRVAGLPVGRPYRMECDQNHVSSGLQGYANNVVRAVQLTCSDLNLVAPPAFADLNGRRDFLRKLADPKYMSVTHPKFKTYDILAATSVSGCGPKDWAEYMVNIPVNPQGKAPGEPLEMFALPPLVAYLYKYGNCLSAEQKNRLLQNFTGQRQRLLDAGTTNHQILRATSWYMLAQYFPNAIWTDWDGKTYRSSKLMEALKAPIKSRFQKFFQQGFDEWLSPTYSLANFFPELNLLLAEDQEMRGMADRALTMQLSVLRGHSFRGTLVAPLIRLNFDQRNGDEPGSYTPAVGQHILWYYYGEPAYLRGRSFRTNTEAFFTSMLLTSDWTPPLVTRTMSISTTGPYEIQTVTPQFGKWGEITPPLAYGSGYLNHDFAVGTGHIVYDPGAYNNHNQTFNILFNSRRPNNAIECYQPYWNSNLGEDAWSTDRSSPFQQMYRYDKSSVVMLFDIPRKDPWVFDLSNKYFAMRDKNKDQLLQVVSCRVPRAVDEIVTGNNWVFVRSDNTYVAIATLHGTNEFSKTSAPVTENYHVFKVRQPRTALFFRVDLASSFRSFKEFQDEMRSRLPNYNASRSVASVIESDGARTDVEFQITPLEGQPGWWSSVPRVRKNSVVQPLPTQAVDSTVMSLKQNTFSLKIREQKLCLTGSVGGAANCK